MTQDRIKAIKAELQKRFETYGTDARGTKPMSIDGVVDYVLPDYLAGTFHPGTIPHADLNVPIALPYVLQQELMTYDATELALVQEVQDGSRDLRTELATLEGRPFEEAFEIRGVRCYHLSKLREGDRGNTEFHRVRKEVLMGYEGLVNIHVEDVLGNKKAIPLGKARGIVLPPKTKHSYEVVQGPAQLFVVANTMFNPKDVTTHDTWYCRPDDSKLWDALAAHYRK